MAEVWMPDDINALEERNTDMFSEMAQPPEWGALPVGDPAMIGEHLKEAVSKPRALGFPGAYLVPQKELQPSGGYLKMVKELPEGYGAVEPPMMAAITQPQFMAQLGRATQRIAKAKAPIAKSGMTGAAKQNLWDVMRRHGAELDPGSYKFLKKFVSHSPKQASATGLHFASPARVASVGTHGKLPWRSMKHEIAGHEVWESLRDLVPKGSAGEQAFFRLDKMKGRAQHLRAAFRRLAKRTENKKLARQMEGFADNAYKLSPEEAIAWDIPKFMEGMSHREATEFFYKNLPQLAKNMERKYKALVKTYETWDSMIPKRGLGSVARARGYFRGIGKGGKP